MAARIKPVSDEQRLLARLGRRVQQDRESLGEGIASAARIAEVGRSTWDKVEKGRGRASGTKYARMEAFLGWSRGAIRRFLEEGGPEPTVVVHEEIGPAGSVAHDLPESPEEWAAVSALLRAMRGNRES